MHNFKSRSLLRPGQTLIEAIIALGILGLITTSVLVLQQSGFNRAIGSSNRLYILIEMKNMLINATVARASKSSPEKKKTIEIPQPVELTYEESPLSARSALSTFKHIRLEKVTALWQDGATKQRDTLIYFFFKAPETESKKP